MAAAEAAFTGALEEARQRALKAEMEKAKQEIQEKAKNEWHGGASAKRRSRRMTTAKRFCSCVKKVKASKKPKTEGSSIAICTSSLLWPHGKTLHSVSCRRKNHLKTQKRKK